MLVPPIIHWLQVDIVTVGPAIVACGEQAETAYLYGLNKCYRHVYVTLSVEVLTCLDCQLHAELSFFARAVQPRRSP
jgi:hypothetical protein